MTWLTWRLHRTEVVIGTTLFAGLLLVMLAGVRSVTAAYDAAEAAGCLSAETGPAVSPRMCGELVNAYWNRSNRWGMLTALLYGVPLALAALLAIPTLQELEHGTFRLAWTQSITRSRWATNRGAFVIGVTLAVTLVFAPVARWWLNALHRQLGGQKPMRFAPLYFDFSLPVLVGYSLFTLTLALTLAVILRRLVPVLAVTAVGFVMTRYVVERFRPRFREPVERVFDMNKTPIPSSSSDWIIGEWWVTSSGDRISNQRLYTEICPIEGSGSSQDFARCVAAHGLHRVVAYQPDDRFWQFQAIETALFLGLAAILLVAAFWWVRRRLT